MLAIRVAFYGPRSYFFTMHEMSIAVNILDIVKSELAKNDAGELKSIKLKIGAMTAVEPESLSFCFSAITEGTDMAGVKLDIEEIAVRGRCNNCFTEFELDRYFSTPCPGCGGSSSELVSGRELDIVSMEVA